MIPKSLLEWNLSVIIDLLTKGYYETEDFDFKEMLPHKSDKAGRQRLLKACCAFANSGGGFLVFGIKDDSILSPQDRMVGLDPAIDFPEHFGNYPLQCEPSIGGWEFLNPPLAVGNGNVIHIVYLPRSWKAPYSMLDLDRPNWRCFPKRTNKGDEEMSYEEIRMAFLQYYEKRLKLQLLRAELESYVATAEEFRKHVMRETYSLGDFSLTVLETVLSDTYSILAEHPDLLALLFKIRNTCRTLNQKLQIFYAALAVPPQHITGIIRNHNDTIYGPCYELINNCNQAIKLLDQITAA